MTGYNITMKKKKNMKPRSVRYDDAEWSHLQKKAGASGTPSDAARSLVQDDMKKGKKKC